MIINHNLSAINAHRNIGINTFHTDKNMESLSSGLRINRAGDDAAGLAVSEKMRSQVRGLHQAGRNAQDTVSFVQTAEGWLNETTSSLQRIRELAVQAANGVYTSNDRGFIQVEVNQLVEEIERISQHAEFNTLSPLNGSFDEPNNPDAVAGAASLIDPTEGGLVGHIGANMDQRIRLFIGNMSAKALGLAENSEEFIPTVSVSSIEGANRSIAQIDLALSKVSEQRADMGAYQNRLEQAMTGINIAAENLQASESRIRDTDMGNAMVNFVKNSILTQSSTSMLAQANLRPQLILRVLG
jgi:flagellin